MDYSNNENIHNNKNINKKRCGCPLCIGFFYIYDNINVLKNNKDKYKIK